MKRYASSFLVISIVFASVIVYINSIHNPFIWDEEVIIVGNPLIKQLGYLPFLFKTDIFGGNIAAGGFFRPIYMLSFIFDYHIWKLNPMGYHIFSVIFHIINALLVCVLADKLGLPRKIAWLAGILFALFPVNCESVALIAARVELIAAFLSLLCVLTFIKGTGKSRIYFYMSYLFLILVVFTKESALVLPLIMLIYSLIFLKKTERRKTFFPLLVLIAIVFAYCGFRLFLLGPPFHKALSLIKEAGFIEKIFTVPRILLTYIGLILFPVVLKSEYNFVVHTVRDPYVWMGIPSLILLFVIARKFLKPKKHALFFLCWVLVGLLPYYNIIVPLHATLMEHWVYFSSIGFAMLISMAIFNIMDRIHSRQIRYISIAALISLILFYAVRIIERNKEWREPFILYQRDSKMEPDSFLLHCNLGVEYFRRGMMKDAEREFVLSNKVCPGAGYNVAYNNLGVICARESRISEAVSYYKQSIALDNYALAYANIGELYNNLKMYKDVISALEKGAKLYPLNIEILYQLGAAYYEDGQIGMARQTFQKVERLQENYSKTKTFLNLINSR